MTDSVLPPRAPHRTPFTGIRRAMTLRDLKFRSKMAVAVALPLCTLLAVTLIGVTSRRGVVATETRAGHLYGPAASLADVVVALDDEARLSNWALAGTNPPADRLAAARAATDRAVDGVRRQVPQLQKAHATAALDRAGRLFDQFDLLGEQRRFIDLGLMPIDAAAGYYNDTVGGVLRVLDSMNATIHDATEVANLRDFTTVVRFLAATGQEHSVLTAGFAQRSLSPGQTSDLLSAIAAQDAYQALFLSQAGPSLRTAFAQRYQPGSSVVNRVHAMRSVALAGKLSSTTVPVQDWFSAGTARQASLRDAVHNVLRAVERSGLDRKHSAERAMLFYGLGAGAALLAALALAYVIVRTTTRPLRQLTVAARDVSERQLPQLLEALHSDPSETDFGAMHPIETTSRDEVGELAHAFNSIETVTVEVAREHAALLRQGISDLYVTLARRNQTLIESQLRSIDELESRESNPETLATLFRVDHFATRMRRNAESLLILAGVDPPRPSTTSVRIFDVVRAAASEIDDYARIDITDVDEETAIAGRVMIDLTHLLAELLENATAFSPPGSRVVVHGAATDDGYELSVVDQGLGMQPDAMAAANLLLREPTPPRLALSHSLGHLVVARLAARAGIQVELRDGSPGVVAVVSIPGALILEPAAGEAPTRTPAEAPLPRRVTRGIDTRARIEAAAGATGTAAGTTGAEGATRTGPPRRPEPVGVDADASRTAGGPEMTEIASGADAEARTRPPGWTASGLPRRIRKTAIKAFRRRAVSQPRPPHEVFETIARYESGRRRGLRDAAAGAASIAEPAARGDSGGPTPPEQVTDRVRPDALPHRKPGKTLVPERTEPEPRPDPRSPEEAFETVARYEWGRRRAQLSGQPDDDEGSRRSDDPGDTAPVEDE